MLIQIPLPYAIALNIPFAIIMAAYGLIPIFIAILLVVVYLVLAVFSMLAQFN